MSTNVRTYLIVSGFVFFIVALVHLARAVNSWAFVVGPITVPVSASWIGFALTAGLCAWAVRLASA